MPLQKDEQTNCQVRLINPPLRFVVKSHSNDVFRFLFLHLFPLPISLLGWYLAIFFLSFFSTHLNSHIPSRSLFFPKLLLHHQALSHPATMPTIPLHFLEYRSPSSDSHPHPHSDSDSDSDSIATFAVPADRAVKATTQQVIEYQKLMRNLPEKNKKELERLQKKYGLTRDQLILAALNEWAPQYVGAFKTAMFFGIV